MSARAKQRRQPALVLLSGCFILSALLRAADPDIARALDAPSEPRHEEPAAPPEAKPSGNLALMLETVREREAQLDEREKAMAIKARVVEAAQEKLRDQMARLEEAEKKLGALLAVADDAAEKDVGKLVASYESMDPKQAGPIFENMDVAFAAGLLSRMKDRSRAQLLGAVAPEKAYAITVFIAGRNAKAPKE